MPHNPNREYAIHYLDRRGRDLAAAAAASVAAGVTPGGTTGGDATGELEGDVRGALLGPLYVQGIHGDEITPPALGADADDLDPEGRDALLWRLDLATFALTGIAAPMQLGEWHVLTALTAGTLRHEDAGSAAENRLLLSGGSDLALEADGTVIAVYDGTSQRWRVFGGASTGGGLTPGSYTLTNDSTDRAFDADATTVDELADVLATLIRDLGGA